MNLNVFIQICGIVNLIVIFFSFFMKKKMVTRNSIIFIEMIIVCFIALGLNIYSTYNLSHYSKLNKIYVLQTTKLYLFANVSLNFLLLRYVIYDVFKTKPVRRTFFNVFSIIVVFAAAIIIEASPLKVRNKDTFNAYPYGTSVYFSFIFILIFLFIVYLFTIIKDNEATKRRKRALRFWVYISGLALIFEFLYNYLILVKPTIPVIGFAFTLAIIVLYIILENPDNSIDRPTWAFNQNKGMEYLNDLNRKKKSYFVLIMVCDLKSPQFRSFSSSQDTMFEYARTLESVHRGRVFKTDNQGYMVVLRKKEYIDQYINAMNEKYNIVDGTTSYSHNLKFIVIDNPYVASDTVNLMSLISDVTTNIIYNHNSPLVTHLDSETINKMNEDRRIEGIVNNAINNDLILVYLQPIYGLEHKSFVSAEALTRIMDPDGNIIYPGSFIEVCERNGSIFKLGTLVFEHICRFIAKYDMDKLGIHYIEVNLSAIQCEYEGIADLYISIMESYGINPKYINLEITETGMANREKMIENMNKLVSYGVSFSLDDFGTGNSNLNYIVDMPVEIVKFDKQMVTAYFNDSKAKFVMNSAISMIKDMNLKIVLEGIEKKSEIMSIQRRKEKIDYIQGYYYSKPISEDDFVKFIVEKNKVKGEILKK